MMRNTQSDKELRSFGLMVGGMFTIIGLWPFVWRGEGVQWWALVLVGVFGGPALFAPWLLRPIHRGWMVIGSGLGWINTRILLGIAFFGLFTPMGLVRRLIMRRDPLQLKFEPQAKTYREVRHPRPATHLKQSF